MSTMGGSFHGLTVVDLFAGSGALGLECLSRGAETCVFVESSRSALKVLAENVERVGATSRTSIVRGDALAWARRQDGIVYDLALADPPYSKGLATALAELFDASPFARELWVEHRSDELLPPTTGLSQRRYGDTTLSTLVPPT